MLRLHKTKRFNLLSLAAGLLALFTVTPALQAQQCKDGVCTIKQRTEVDSNYRFDVGRARYDYPTYSEDRFPEFNHLRETTPTPRYREPRPRPVDRSDYLARDGYQPSFRPTRDRESGPRPVDRSDYLARDEYQPSFRSTRDSEWRRYHDEFERRERQRDDYRVPRQRNDAPARTRDYRYSGYDFGNTDSRSRPVRERYRSENLGDLRDSLDSYHTPRRSDELDRYRDFGPTLRDRLPRDRGYEELPAPQPERDSKEPTLNDKVTARYSNPTVVRFATTLGGNQGLALFREVSTLIDQRHLSPKTYTERIRNGARNIEVALQNRSFLSAVSLQASESQLSQFRSELSRLAVRPIMSRSDAEQVVTAAMQLGSQAGLRPGLIAYEFANGSIQSLDKYSALEPSVNRVSGAVDDAESKTASLDEYVTGVGIEVRHHKDGLEIVRALRGGPAVEAGIQSGDIIRQISGRNIGGTEMNTSVAMISGQIGTRVSFLIAREGRGTKTFNLTRRRFRVYSVNDVKMVDRQTGYLHLNKFAKSSAAEMDRAIQDLKSQGMRNLIVDVRGNPGGLLTTAIEVSDKFLRCGKIVATRGRLASDNSVETASANGTWSMPLVVLVDGDSASASEIFAAAIQENGRGIVIGEKSYGKGTVQTHFPLGSGLGTVRLTTAKFYSPTDREMSGAGVTPDVRTTDAKDALNRAITAASHPKLAEMVAQHGTCRPGSAYHNAGSASRPATDLSVVLSN